MKKSVFPHKSCTARKKKYIYKVHVQQITKKFVKLAIHTNRFQQAKLQVCLCRRLNSLPLRKCTETWGRLLLQNLPKKKKWALLVGFSTLESDLAQVCNLKSACKINCTLLEQWEKKKKKINTECLSTIAIPMLPQYIFIGTAKSCFYFQSHKMVKLSCRQNPSAV